MACRWGGEEFIVIAPNTTLEHMAGVAEKVRLAVLHAMQEHAPPVTISLGVASASGSPIDATQLLTAADAALYVAKQKGRNRVELAGSI
jgi:diguanylate cyclase (GGDEF)-like protein